MFLSHFYSTLPLHKNRLQQPRWALGLVFASLLFMLGMSNSKGQAEFKELQSLSSLSKQAQAQQLPIMIMFGAQWCDYCQVLKEQVFNPMALGGMYEGRVVLMRHVGVDEQASIPGFDGQPLNKAEWAYKLNADLTPTVLFLDSTGQEIAPRIVGIQEVTMYVGVIHKRLNSAYQAMGLDKRIPVTPEALELMQAQQSQLNQ